jgi:hypothetical protein
MTDYLHTCLGLHAELTSQLYGKPQDLAAVERASARIRSSRRLTYEDIQLIADSPHWNPHRFWRWPTAEQVEAALSGPWDFWHLPKHEDRVIPALLRVFKFIEPVSVLLRFIVPEHYGILSPPVEKALEVPPAASVVEKYFHYLRDLRTVRASRGFSSAAEVDMALWVLQRGVLTGILPESRTLSEAYEADSELRGIRCRNLAQGLFSGTARLDLAEALLPLNATLAAEIASIEFEREVRLLARATRDEDLGRVIGRLNDESGINGVTHGKWQAARELRNDALHANRVLSPREVTRLIEEARAAHQKAEVRKSG